MRIIYGIWTFYKKLIVPVSSVSFLTGVLIYLTTGSASYAIKFTGISYLFFTPMFQYFIYEIRSPHEYYFYYNLGISKLVLWLSSVILSLFTCLIIMLI